MKIFNIDLIKRKFDENTLIENLDHLNEKIILNTQILSEEFCAKYIYCVNNINDGDEDSYLFDINHILDKQPHLNENKLIQMIDELKKN